MDMLIAEQPIVCIVVSTEKLRKEQDIPAVVHPLATLALVQSLHLSLPSKSSLKCMCSWTDFMQQLG